MRHTEIIRIFSGFIGAIGFAVLFNTRDRRLFIAALGGLISWTLFVIFSKIIDSESFNYFLVELIIAVYAEIMARVLKTPTTTFISTSLIPLIPGGSLYYPMTYAFKSNFEGFLEKGLYTLKLASSLALGIIVATTLSKFIFGSLTKHIANKE